MKVDGIDYRTIWVSPDSESSVEIIDQRQLPHRFVTVSLEDIDAAYRAIKDMLVRGAGLIGATAGYGMYLAALQADDNGIMEELEKAGSRLKSARPTARNLGWAVDRVLATVAQLDSASAIRHTALATATAIADEDADFCRMIGEHGRSLIETIAAAKQGQPVNILTHCNAGWLAFVDYGSATAPILRCRPDRLDGIKGRVTVLFTDHGAEQIAEQLGAVVVLVGDACIVAEAGHRDHLVAAETFGQ